MHRFVLNAGGAERATVLANIHQSVDVLPDTRSWRVEIRQHRKQRSTDQNNALWGVAYPPLCAAAGYEPDELHDAFCRKFFGTRELWVMGERVTRPVRTTTTNERGERDVLPAAEFAQFYDMVQRVGAEIGVHVPDPDPMHAIKNTERLRA